MATTDSKQRIIAIEAVIIVALLAVLGVLLFNKFNQDTTISEQQVQIDEGVKLKEALEKQYYESLSELEEMKTNNEELNTMIEEQQAELTAQKEKIAGLISNGRDLKNARAEMRNMKSQLDGYVEEITQLKEQNELLAGENLNLQTEKTELQGNLTTLNEEYETTKATFASEKDELTNKNAELSQTVTYASVVKASAVNVDGLMIKNSGKTKKTAKADKVDQLKMCFNTTVNEVTKPGKEKFYVRIINPVGETLAIEEMGSGIMTSSKTKEQIRYTQVKEYDYANDEAQLCFLWQPNVPFQEGTYAVEIYNKGYLAGTGSFELK